MELEPNEKYISYPYLYWSFFFDLTLDEVLRVE